MWVCAHAAVVAGLSLNQWHIDRMIVFSESGCIYFKILSRDLRVNVMNIICTGLATHSIHIWKAGTSKHCNWCVRWFSYTNTVQILKINIRSWCNMLHFSICSFSPVPLNLHRQKLTLSSSLIHLLWQNSSAIQVFLCTLFHLAEKVHCGLFCELLWCAVFMCCGNIDSPDLAGVWWTATFVEESFKFT